MVHRFNVCIHAIFCNMDAVLTHKAFKHKQGCWRVLQYSIISTINACSSILNYIQ